MHHFNIASLGIHFKANKAAQAQLYKQEQSVKKFMLLYEEDTRLVKLQVSPSSLKINTMTIYNFKLNF